jgi:hypothetical protein
MTLVKPERPYTRFDLIQRSFERILPFVKWGGVAAPWSFYICPPFSKGDAAFFAAGDLRWLVPHPL